MKRWLMMTARDQGDGDGDGGGGEVHGLVAIYKEGAKQQRFWKNKDKISVQLTWTKCHL